MDKQKRKAAVVGALNIDIGGISGTALVARDSLPGQVNISFGGVGWNVARDCAALGLETEFFSVLGLDEFEHALKRDAEDYGVSIAGCRWENAVNNRYLYIDDRDGDMVAAVNDMRLCGRIDAEFVGNALPRIAEAGVIVADANLPQETIAFLARNAPAPLVADCVSSVKCGKVKESLPFIHTLKANRLEAETLTGRTDAEDCVRALADAGVRRAVVTLGGHGAICAENGRVFRVPAEPSHIADTTGAGDSVTAALTVGLLKGWDLEECAVLGMRAAAVTMGQKGAVTHELSRLTEEWR